MNRAQVEEYRPRLAASGLETRVIFDGTRNYTIICIEDGRYIDSLWQVTAAEALLRKRKQGKKRAPHRIHRGQDRNHAKAE